MKKSNKNLSFVKDSDKTYVYIKDGKKEVGMLCWHFSMKKWVFEDEQGKKRRWEKSKSIKKKQKYQGKKKKKGR